MLTIAHKMLWQEVIR